MVCQICGKRSGYYPLCDEHFRMRDEGLVEKCKGCKKWYIVSKGCPRCKSGGRQPTQTKKNAKAEVSFVADEAIAPLIKKMLSHAKEFVLIASPWMWGIEDIVQRLEQLKRKNVAIRILTRRSKETDKKHYRTVSKLYDIGCDIDFDDELHAKIVLVDDKELYIGSANLVATSLERNKEAGIHTINHDTALDAGDYLIDAFDEAFKKRLLK